MKSLNGNYRIAFLISILTLICVHTSGQRIKTIAGQYRYIVPENITLAQAKQTAANQAKIDALSKEFGTYLSQSNASITTNSSQKSDSKFMMLGISEVKGEWLQDIEPSLFDIQLENNVIVIVASVKGKAREIVTVPIDLQCDVLSDPNSDKENSNFKNGQNIYLKFKSPTNGYLVVYLVNEQGESYRLLPYRRQSDAAFAIAQAQSHMLFSIDHAGTQKSLTDEYLLTCDTDNEINYLYIVFSPDPFVKANDTSSSSELPAMLHLEDLQKWLAKNRIANNKFQLKIKTLIITK